MLAFDSMKKTHSTKEVADLAEIHEITLLRWTAAVRVRPSQVIQIGERELWRWTDADVRRVLLFKEKHYREGQGRRKPKAKQ